MKLSSAPPILKHGAPPPSPQRWAGRGAPPSPQDGASIPDNDIHNTHCEMRVKMWYCVVFWPSKCRNAHIQPQFWSIWSIFPNNSESLTKVCYINWKDSEILSRVGALYLCATVIGQWTYICRYVLSMTRCQIWCTIELHRDPISKVLLEW